jgi:putative membrane protein
MMWGSGFGMGWAGWLVMGLGTIAFWVVVVLVVRALLPTGGTPAPKGHADPLGVLNERLARGDVTPEEYEQRRRLIVD